MPSLGSDMEAATLIQWMKKPGEAVKRGDIIAVVDTEKGAIEIEVFDDGILDRTLIEPGQKVPVGTALARIRSAGEPAGAGEPPIPVTPPVPDRRASPAARKAAEAMNVDLAAVAGTGPGGAITREDVERAAAPRQPTTAAASTTPSAAPAVLAGDRAAAMRSAIAAAMSRSKREIPHLYLSTAIDMTAALAWLTSENQKRSIERRLLPAVLLVKATAAAAREIAEVNGYWLDGAFRPGPGVHLGCAIALRDGGLVAPAIHDADQKDLDSIMTELTDLVARARRGTLRSSELADSTITLTNLGDLGVDAAFAIIYPPQVAIVAFGRPVARPWVVADRIEPRTVLTASVSADHRAVDGRRAGQFLAAIERRLQAPEQL